MSSPENPGRFTVAAACRKTEARRIDRLLLRAAGRAHVSDPDRLNTQAGNDRAVNCTDACARID